MIKNKVISRIKGGLGNQLFCYAAARRLALINDAELVIDNVSGFVRDHQFRRKYMLDKFAIPHRTITTSEGLQPFERYRRALLKWVSRRKPFESRLYIEQDLPDFDERLLALKVNGTIYLDGLWQCEKYFKDIEQVIRDELHIIPPTDRHNLAADDIIQKTNSVALHVRWFDNNYNNTASINASYKYYLDAISYISNNIRTPHFFIFSDNTEAALNKLKLNNHNVTCIDHNHGDDNAFADLWLMSHCKHCITANSTFSWWGAWLNQFSGKIVISPDNWDNTTNKTGNLVPLDWLRI